MTDRLKENVPTGTKQLRNAATLLVVRDAGAGMEVLMLQRPERVGDLYSGACVFPGGVVEDSDRQAYAHCEGPDDQAASASLRLDDNGLGYFVAAVRECFEEAGLLFAYDSAGGLLDFDRVDAATLAGLRLALRSGETRLSEACAGRRWKLAVDRLAYHSHWLTPPGLPKRFDTRFFLAVAPAKQTVLADGQEALRHFWLTPAQALARAVEFKLRPATISTLESLTPFADAGACWQATRALRHIEMRMPQLGASP